MKSTPFVDSRLKSAGVRKPLKELVIDARDWCRMLNQSFWHVVDHDNGTRLNHADPVICHNVSSVVEKVSHPETPEAQPNRGLKLKSKAIARKKDKPQKKIQEIEKES